MTHTFTTTKPWTTGQRIFYSAMTLHIALCTFSLFNMNAAMELVFAPLFSLWFLSQAIANALGAPLYGAATIVALALTVAYLAIIFTAMMVFTISSPLWHLQNDRTAQRVAQAQRMNYLRAGGCLREMRQPGPFAPGYRAVIYTWLAFTFSPIALMLYYYIPSMLGSTAYTTVAPPGFS